MAKVRRTNRKVRRNRTVAKRRRGVRARRTTTKKLIRRVMQSSAETKRSQFYQLSRNVYSSNTTAATFNSANILSLTPGAGIFEITQNATVTGRIGNKITVKRNRWTIIMHPNPYQATTNPVPCPLLVSVVLFYEKEQPLLYPQNVQNDFFMYGSAYQGMLADPTDNYSPYNTEKYRILKVFKKKVGLSSYTGSGNAPGYSYFANNDFSYNWVLKINVAKYAPKRITYANNAIGPKTRGVFMLIHYSRADGVIDTPAWSSLNAQLVGDFRYSDV